MSALNVLRRAQAAGITFTLVEADAVLAEGQALPEFNALLDQHIGGIVAIVQEFELAPTSPAVHAAEQILRAAAASQQQLIAPAKSHSRRKRARS
jgi:hypothetical protein